MNKYLHASKITFMMGVAYPARFFSLFGLDLLMIICVIALFKSLYGAESVVQGYSLASIVTYFAVSMVTKKFTGSSKMISIISRAVKSGSYSLLLTKAMSPNLYLIVQMLASRVVSLLLPISFVIIGTVFFKEYFVPPANILVFFISVTLGTLISTLFSMVVAVSAFWFVESKGFAYLIGRTSDIMGGKVIPLEFLPAGVISASYFLPFRYMHFIPLSIYVGNTKPDEYLYSLSIQFLLVITMYVIYKVVWFFGIRRYGAVGN